MKKIIFVFVLIAIFLSAGIKKSDALSCIFSDHKYYVEYENGSIVNAFKTKINYSGGTDDSCPTGYETIIELDSLDSAKEAFSNNFDSSKSNSGIYEVTCFSEDNKICLDYKKLDSVDNLEKLKKEIPLKEFQKKITMYLLFIPSIIFPLAIFGLSVLFDISILYFTILMLVIIFFFFGVVVFFKKVRYLGFLLLISLFMKISAIILLWSKITSYKAYSLNKFAKPDLLANMQKDLYIINILGIMLLITILCEIGYYIYKKIMNYKNKQIQEIPSSSN